MRAAIDGDAPVPRIERPTNGNYTLHVGNVVKPYTFEVPFEMLDAMSKLAGKPLPIWEPKGTWKELPNPMHLEDGLMVPDFKAWRYTR